MRAVALRRARPERATLVKAVLVIVAIAIAVAPMLYVVSAALKPGRTLLNYPPQWLPKELYVDNFTRLVTDTDFPRWLANSVGVATLITVIKVTIDSMAAYALAKMRFPGQRVIFGLMLATIMVPPSLLLIPLYFIMRDAALLDSYWALILPALASPFGIVVLRAFIRGLPDELEHAARVDGATPWRIYWHVILPSIRPGLVVVAGYVFIASYIDFVWPLVANQSSDLMVVTTGLASLAPRANVDVDYGLVSAGALCALIPVALVALLLQRQLRGSDLSAGLKG